MISIRLFLECYTYFKQFQPLLSKDRILVTIKSIIISSQMLEVSWQINPLLFEAYVKARLKAEKHFCLFASRSLMNEYQQLLI